MSKNNVQKLAGKVAVVTGGSRGIGSAIAKRLAADGTSVAITYAKDAGAASSVVRAIELDGARPSRSKRTLPTSKRSRPRSKRLSRLSADLMCL
jgi:NAD(P)-dependent dehydrogenase (short-subunit alcohol dehydrogenase family)